MKVVKNILPSVLAIIFLLLSFNISINKMVCLKSGATTVSLLPTEDCCEEESSLPILKTNCCDTRNFTINLKDYNFVQKSNIPNATVLCIALCGYNLTQLERTPVFITNITNPLPPSLYGRGLLSFISILTI